MEKQPIEIPINKAKLGIVLVAALVFVAVGTWIIIDPPIKTNLSVLRNPVTVYIFGMASILLFGLISILIVRKLLDRAPGLVISNDGITDNTSGISVGFIPWSDVVEIKDAMIRNQPILNVVVKNPQAYIDRQTSRFKKAALQMNYDSSGMVISITMNSLKMDAEELKALLFSNFQGYRRRVGAA